MKKFLYAFAILLIITSCSKWSDDSSKNLVYYGEDYKEKEVGFFNISSDEVDAVWFDFHQTGKDKKYNGYTMNVESNGKVLKTLGTCSIDWNDKITFTPNSGNSFIGSWTYGKEKYVITYDLDNRSETVTFVYKKQEHCK